MKEISRVCNKEKTDHSKVTYDFETNTLQGQSMPLEEYNKVKATTIKRAKQEGWNLTFELV